MSSAWVSASISIELSRVGMSSSRVSSDLGGGVGERGAVGQPLGQRAAVVGQVLVGDDLVGQPDLIARAGR